MPSRLYIAADGPQQGAATDFDQYQAVRSVKDQIDWNCEVMTLYREEHLGPNLAVSTAVDWFFANEAEGIILEDDCVPTRSFFRFCQELLDRYRDDNRVMHVCGMNPLGIWDKEAYAYYFSRHASVCGWAGWRRAWKLRDFSKVRYEAVRRQGFFDEFFPTHAERATWFQKFEKLAAVPKGEISWVDEWAFSRFVQSGLSIVPRESLVTSLDQDLHGNVDGGEPGMDSSIEHPPFVMRNLEADAQYFTSVVQRRNSF